MTGGVFRWRSGWSAPSSVRCGRPRKRKEMEKVKKMILFGVSCSKPETLQCQLTWFTVKEIRIKQWPLAGEFVEFEYSPKWPFWKIGRTRYIRPTIANHFPRTLYIRPTFANHFARTRQTRERQVWQLLHEFSEFSEFGKFSECRLDRFIHKNIFFVYKTTYLACADIGRPTLPGLDTFARHSPTIFPGLDTFVRHSPTISPDSIHSLTFDIHHLWEKCDLPRHIRASNSPFWRIWGEWPLLNKNPSLYQIKGKILTFEKTDEEKGYCK